MIGLQVTLTGSMSLIFHRCLAQTVSPQRVASNILFYADTDQVIDCQGVMQTCQTSSDDGTVSFPVTPCISSDRAMDPSLILRAINRFK